MKPTKLFIGLLAMAAVALASCSKSNREPAKYAIMVTAASKGGAAYADLAEAHKGATVTLTAETDDNFTFKRWIVESGDVTLADASSATTTFTMPAGAVTVRAEFTVIDVLLAIPDPIFKAFCAKFGTNDKLTAEEAAKVTEINLWDAEITDVASLEGIEFFTGLTELDCSDNQLLSLDVSGCTKLTKLYCSYNQLLSLDVSGCTKLKYLNCDNNKLRYLYVSKCTELRLLSCYNNKLISLNLSGCPKLGYFNCSNNHQLTSLNVSGCTELGWLKCINN